MVSIAETAAETSTIAFCHPKPEVGRGNARYYHLNIAVLFLKTGIAGSDAVDAGLEIRNRKLAMEEPMTDRPTQFPY